VGWQHDEQREEKVEKEGGKKRMGYLPLVVGD